MFTPMGNKKYLLQKKWGLEGSPPPKTRHQSLDFSALGTMPEHNFDRKGESVKSGSVSGKQSAKESAISIASSANLEKALANPGTLGIVMNRVLASTSRYRPEKDAVVLKVFQSKNIDYDIFRNALYSTFWLQFNDEEYQVLLDYFDPQHNGVVNGYDFMIAFIRLGGIRKDRMSIEVREKQELFEKQQKEEEERKKLEKEKKMELAANFNFSDEVRQRAHQKLLEAAIAFDASHPSSPSLEGFHVTTMKPYTFRELIKLTFNLKVDRDELGAILTAYDAEINETNSNINASGFLKYFLRLGIDGRHKEKQAQRHRQASMTEAALEEQAKKAKAAAEKMLMTVDYNYQPSDELSATGKLRDASTKYDKAAPGAVALDGFECESLNPGQFRDIMRQVFNIVLTNQELGFLVQKYDLKKIGSVHCKTFLTDFFRLGQEQRHKLFIEQLDRQRTAIKEAHDKHLKKMHEVQNSAKIDISLEFTEMDLQSALQKLTHAAIRYDKTRGASMISFEGSHLSALEFKKAIKRTFNLKLNPKELGALVKYFDNDDSGRVDCPAFLTTFTTLGAAEKYKIRAEQLSRQREENRIRREEEAKKVLSLANKVKHEAEFEFTEADRDSAMQKLTVAAKKYDPNHPSAQALHGFERNAMQPAEFKELVRRTFNLRLTSPEVGAIFKIFDESEAEYPLPSDQIDCGDFLKYFMSLGFAERAEVFREQLERQRRENREREEEHQRKVEALASRGTFKVDMDFTDEDRDSIMEKVNKAAFGFDKSHPAAPSLEAFEVSHMPPGLFRENLKRVFHIHASPKEIGYLMSIFDKDKVGQVDSKEFMLKFQDIGKKARAKKHSEFLDSKRAAAKALKREAEEKLAAQYAKAELQVDYDCSADDYNSAIAKLTESSIKYDKTHPSAPSLDGFTGGAISPGVFRELLRRAFNVWLAPKELGAIVSRYRHDSDPNLIDGKQFLIAFMRLGFDARAAAKAQTLEKQRKAAKDRKLEEELKLHLASQRVVLKVEDGFTSADRESAMVKLRAAAMKYDKNAPGCVSMEAFDAAFLTPGMFREVIKRTVNLVFEPKELAAMLKEFDNGHGNVDSRGFLVRFIHMGSEERDKVKAIQLDKQRKQNFLRKTEHERKMKEAEDKMIIEVNYDYTPEERDSAFQKLTVAAKKYDKGHPGAMSLDGFEEQYLKAHVFREMLKRTFGVILTAGELGAVMHYFDKKKSGLVMSKKFLIYFLKVGIAEREQDHRTSLAKLRKDQELREREHTEKLAAQWAKIELNLTEEFTPEEKVSALEKLAEAAMKFDPASPGPMGLTAFEASVLSPGVFREMLKRSFNLLVTPGELAALVAEFDKSGKKLINCKEFMVRFTTLGVERRSQRKAAQLEKQRLMDLQAKEEELLKREKLSTKLDFNLENNYSDADLHSALEKIRVIAANYDRAHAAAPSLKGFMGTNMKPHEFKDMLNRTFHVLLTARELTALTNYFPGTEPSKVLKGAEEEGEGVSERPRSAKPPDVRIHNQQFLNYFNKIQREEQNKRRRARIQKERELIQREQEAREALIKEKQQHEFSLLENTPEDELSMLSKIRNAAQEYAIDPSLYNELMQGFKGPALPPNKFQELFRQIFSIRLTFPELGVLLGILDTSGIGTFDGGRFLNWFYKISRLEEQIMLGHSQQEVTLDTLRLNVRRPHTSTGGSSGSVISLNQSRKIGTAVSGATAGTSLTETSVPATNKSVGAITTTSSQPAKSVSSTAVQPSSSKPTTATAGGGKVAPSPAPSVSAASVKAGSTTAKTSKNRYPYNFSEVDDEAEEDDYDALEPSSAAASFSKATLKQSWFLPSLTSAPPATIYAGNSSISTQYSMVSNSGDDLKYLKSIFDASVESSASLLHSNSVGAINSIDEKVGKQVVEKLIGPANQQPRLGGTSGKPLKHISNVAVYGGLSASGEVPPVLAAVKPVRNVHTAPSVGTKRRPLSPVSDQLLLAPQASIELNHSMELKLQKQEQEVKEQKLAAKQALYGHKPKTVVKPIKSKKFGKSSVASASGSGGPITPQVTELIIPTANSHEKEVEFLHTLFSPEDVSGLLSAQTSQFNASMTSAGGATSVTAAPRLANNSESLLAKLDQLTQQMAKRPRKKVYIKPAKVDQSIEPIAPPSNPKPTSKSLTDSMNSGAFFFPTGLAFAESFDSTTSGGKSPKDKNKEEKPYNEEDLYDDDGNLLPVVMPNPSNLEVDEKGHEFDGPQGEPSTVEMKKPSTVLKGAPTIKKTSLLLVPKNKGNDVAVDEAAAKESVDILRQIMTTTVI